MVVAVLVAVVVHSRVDHSLCWLAGGLSLVGLGPRDGGVGWLVGLSSVPF